VSAESDMNALLATSHRPRPAAASVSAPLDLTTHPDVRIASPEGRAASNRPSVSDFLSATSPGTKQTGTSQVVPTALRTAKDSSKQQLLAKTRGDSAADFLKAMDSRGGGAASKLAAPSAFDSSTVANDVVGRPRSRMKLQDTGGSSNVLLERVALAEARCEHAALSGQKAARQLAALRVRFVRVEEERDAVRKQLNQARDEVTKLRADNQSLNTKLSAQAAALCSEDVPQLRRENARLRAELEKLQAAPAGLGSGAARSPARDIDAMGSRAPSTAAVAAQSGPSVAVAIRKDPATGRHRISVRPVNGGFAIATAPARPSAAAFLSAARPAGDGAAIATATPSVGSAAAFLGATSPRRADRPSVGGFLDTVAAR